MSDDQRTPETPTPVNGHPRAGVTLVLGGGGFKGMAHIGVLLALEEHGIPIQRIVGTSAGALMGCCYSYAGSAAKLLELSQAFVSSDALQSKGFIGFHGRKNGGNGFMSRVVSGIKRQVALERMFRRSSAFGGAALRFVVRSLVPNVRIEDLDPPVAIAALDIVRGEEVLLTEGPLCSAVCASSSVPGFFPPVERQGRVLVDAGIVNNLPTRAARSLGADRIVAVDLSSRLGEWRPDDAGMDVLLRAQDISTRLANRRWSDHADVVLYPDLDGRGWLDASEPEKAIGAGHAAVETAIEEIHALQAGGRLDRRHPGAPRRATDRV